MVNINDLDELNNLGFGADVDKLESYVIHLRECRDIGITFTDDAEYKKCIELLRKLKPESVMFIGNWCSECEQMDQFDKLLKIYRMHPYEVAYTMNDMQQLKEYISDIECLDESLGIEICSFVRGIGVEVRVVYSRGYVVCGSLQSRFLKGQDITNHVKHSSIPKYVDDWKKIDIVELRGIVTINYDNYYEISEQFKAPLHCITSIIKAEATEITSKHIKFIFNELLIDKSEQCKLECGTSKSSIKDYLDECGFLTPDCAVIKDVNYYNFEESVQSIIDYFAEQSSNDEIERSYSGIDIMINSNDISSQFEYRKDGVTLSVNSITNSKVYSSVISGIEWEASEQYMKPTLLIDRTITVNGDIVDKVEVDNINIIEKDELCCGKEIQFKFINGKAILYKQVD